MGEKAHVGCLKKKKKKKKKKTTVGKNKGKQARRRNVPSTKEDKREAGVGAKLYLTSKKFTAQHNPTTARSRTLLKSLVGTQQAGNV